MQPPKPLRRKVISFFLILTGTVIPVLALVLQQAPIPVFAVANAGPVGQSYPPPDGTNTPGVNPYPAPNTSTPVTGATFTRTPTRTVTRTPTRTSTSTSTATYTATATRTFTATATRTFTATTSNTAVVPSATRTPTRVNTNTSVPPAATYTSTPIRVVTNTAVPPSPTFTPTRVNTITSVPPTATNTRTVVVATQTPTRTSTSTMVPSVPTQVKTATPTASATPIASPTFTRTAAPTATQTQSPASGTKVTLRPMADTYVDQKSPSTAFGDRKYIILDKDPINAAFLRFDLSGIDLSKVAKVELLVYVGEGSDKGFQVRLIPDNSWSEGSLNFSNPPSPGIALGSSGQPVTSTWLRVNLFPEGTSPNFSSGTVSQVSLGLVPLSTDAFYISSREAGILAPQLVLIYK